MNYLPLLVEKIKELSKLNHEGFTFHLSKFKLINNEDHGRYVVSYKETQNSTNAYDVVKHALQNGLIVGGWKDSDTGKYYLDSCKLFDNYNEAINFAQQNDQIAIFDLKEFKEIRVKTVLLNA
jgi:fructokinase